MVGAPGADIAGFAQLKICVAMQPVGNAAATVAPRRRLAFPDRGILWVHTARPPVAPTRLCPARRTPDADRYSITCPRDVNEIPSWFWVPIMIDSMMGGLTGPSAFHVT